MKHQQLLVPVYKVVTIYFMNTLSGFKYFIQLTNSKRALWMYFYYFQISFSLVSERLRYFYFVYRHNFTSANYTKIPVLVFDTEIGR